jgi:aerobic C4-dicarboxylate transport protein
MVLKSVLPYENMYRMVGILLMKLIRSLYFWILIAFFSGCALGTFNPKLAILMEPLGTSFIKFIKVFIGPIVFLTVATGIAQTGSLKKLSKIGIITFVYFEIVSSIALLIGWAAASIAKPGSMVHANLNLLDKKPVVNFLGNAEKLSVVDFLQNLIPSNIVEPFSNGNMLQILLIAILFGLSLLAIGENRSKTLIETMDKITQSLFQIIRLIMYFAPLGVFGAMSFTIAKFGGHLLIPLLRLIGTFYLTGFLFIFVILGTIAKLSGFSIIHFVKYIKHELLLILGTSSSESALPQLLQKLEKLGCQKKTIGIVVPIGYSFNLDGTNIYITLAALFIAQALGIQLTIMQQLAIFITAMLSSKGAAGVTGAGFITLAATLSVVPTIPAIGIVLILGIDRFMSEARSLINYIGNGVASLAISRWENEVSAQKLNQIMNEEIQPIILCRKDSVEYQ